MKHHLVLRIVSKLLIPAIFLFALYVQFHGDFGPGGGFQAGVIFAAAIILYAMVFGLEKGEQVIPATILRMLLAGGVGLYAMVGVVAMLRGGRFLEYGVLAGSPVTGQHVGILLVEFGVGMTVTAAMLTIYFAFAGRERAE
jgi:multicomponent Na+:H+ antiporter subunit B